MIETIFYSIFLLLESYKYFLDYAILTGGEEVVLNSASSFLSPRLSLVGDRSLFLGTCLFAFFSYIYCPGSISLLIVHYRRYYAPTSRIVIERDIHLPSKVEPNLIKE